MLAAAFFSPAQAQTPSQPETTFHCPGSILHGRTQPIAQAILAALPTGTACNQVTLNQLSSITRLSLTNHSLTSLRTNDFAGMSGLQVLSIESNQLTNLPSGVFDELVNLRTLGLYRNRLSSLPTGIFDNLTRLQRLAFSGNQISNLPAGIFDELTDLRSLVLDRTPLTSLPAGIFDELTNLTLLFLERNQLASLPPGIFDELTKLTFIELHDTLLTSLPANIFDKLIDMEHLDIKSNLLTSLPANIFEKLPKLHTLELQNNRLTSLPDGIFDRLTRLQTLYLHDNQLTSLPDGVFDELTNLQTLTLSGNSLPFIPCTDTNSPLYGRTKKVVEAILDALGSHNCDQVTTNQLASITGRLSLNGITSLQTNDFAGLSGLQSLHLDNNQLTNLPAGIFEDLVNLNTLDLSDNQISALPAGVFDPLANLQTLRLQNNRLASLPDGIFDRLTNLRNEVELSGNPLSIEISLFPLALEVTEGNQGFAYANLQVRISQAYAEDVSVRYTTQDGSATAGLDYTPTNGMLTFPAGATSLTQTISIPIRGDTDFEPNEYLNLLLSNPTNAIIHLSTARIEIVNDDSAAPPLIPLPGRVTLPSLIFSADRLTISEGQTATYLVRATTLLPDDIIVRIRSNHPQIVVEPQTLVFAPTNWMHFQAIQVRASAAAADTNKQAYIMHSIPASEGFIARNNAGAVSLTIAHKVVEKPNGQDSVDPEEPVAPEPQLPPTDYDRDDDGLIEVSHLAQLHALRFDLNGDGQPDKEEVAAAYKQAFPSAIANMGVPNHIQAQGYELATNLTFDTNGDKTINEEDAFWNKGNGWPSIGSFSEPFQAVFEGNGHTIDNLFQNQSAPALFANEPSGLFGAVGHQAQIVHVVLEGVEIRGVNWVGALAGLSQGVLVNCSVRGRVVGYNSVGGLVGHNFGEIADSHVRGEVRGETSVGGLVGWNVGGLIEGSSALGQETLGLVGFGTPAAR